MEPPSENRFPQHCCLVRRGMICRAGKLGLQILLLVIFLYFFGLPALERFQRKEVMMVDTEKDTGGIYLPEGI